MCTFTLLEKQKIVRLSDDLYIHPGRLSAMQEQVVAELERFRRDQPELPGIERAALTTRKYAIPLLDYMDTIGVTRRVGNTRYLK